MWSRVTTLRSMKEESGVKYGESTPAALELRDVATMPNVGLVIPLRAAKAKLSALLELVASGQRITITSGGVPKVVLSPAREDAGRKAFTGMGEFLVSQQVHGGPSAEELVREDRDGRGW
ncbi:MAG: Antitoxin [Verrucomicrobiales bacterium]|nr:Antitoxin [Verrucomicrobiales bacterium]